MTGPDDGAAAGRPTDGGAAGAGDTEAVGGATFARRGRTRGARREASVVAQAKINLFLRVLAREASGYHQLETLFQRLALGDDVRVRTGVRGRSLDCRGASVGPVERNLAWRAAVAYAEATGWPDGFAVEVDKHIPVGGGLGGGSADAGAVLRCLNALAPRPLGTADLLALAAGLGADVPFLTAEAPLALAWGRGERMLALPPLPPRRVHLALFAEGVSTPEAFALLAERRAGAPGPRPIVWTLDRFATWDDVALVATNDFEAVVLPLRDDVAGLRGMFGEVVRRVDALHDAAADDEVADEATTPEDALVPAPGEESGPASRSVPTPGDRVPIALMTGTGATVYLLSPLAGVQLAFEVSGPAEGSDGAATDHEAIDGEAIDGEAIDGEGTDDDGELAPGLRVVETRTVDRVAAVQLAG